jgi:hypothetical protein
MQAKGCFTQDKFIAGKSLRDIEKILGFKEGRLARGGYVYALTRLPEKNEFQVAGYTNVSLHNFKMPKDLNVDVLKRNAMELWELKGWNRLVKVVPIIPHDKTKPDDEQYPHARGVPQWVVTKELPCMVAGALGTYPDGVYTPKY